MLREHLPITALSAWSKLNDATLLDVIARELGCQGYGIVTERALTSNADSFDSPILLEVANDLVLSRDSIDEYAKVDKHLKELLEVAGGSNFRIDAMLFLLMQITMTAKEHGQIVGVSNPWTEYVKILPESVPLPTLWTEEECMMLQGTSLESALAAKLASLSREFEAIQNATASIAWCQKCWWEYESFQFEDWKLIDAWFRSRVLEHPTAGQCMIPVLDMVNHAVPANSYYELSTSNAIHLLLRPGLTLEDGTEVTISYGDTKSTAEMIFSYGFVDDTGPRQSMTLPLEPDPSDPLGKAKSVVYTGSKTVQLVIEDGQIHWKSPYLFLLSLNQEDGLDFRILQENDGTTSSLRVFWKDCDVTEATDNIDELVKKDSNHLREVFKLRAVALLEQRLHEQLLRLHEADDVLSTLADSTDLAISRQEIAIELRERERGLLIAALKEVKSQKENLVGHENVRRYLGLSDDQDNPTSVNAEEADEDFS